MPGGSRSSHGRVVFWKQRVIIVFSTTSPRLLSLIISPTRCPSDAESQTLPPSLLKEGGPAPSAKEVAAWGSHMFSDEAGLKMDLNPCQEHGTLISTLQRKVIHRFKHPCDYSGCRWGDLELSI